MIERSAGQSRAAEMEMLRNPFKLLRSATRFAGRLLCEPAPTEWERWLAGRRAAGHISMHVEFTGRAPTPNRISIGDKCSIERDVTMWLCDDPNADPKISLSDGVYVGRNSYLGSHAPLTIGANTLIGAYCYIITAGHKFDRRDIPIIQQGFSGAPIMIGADVWLGTHVIVLPGVSVGQGAIVGAGSVVTRNVPPFEIWGGTPAKFIKLRP